MTPTMWHSGRKAASAVVHPSDRQGDPIRREGAALPDPPEVMRRVLPSFSSLRE